MDPQLFPGLTGRIRIVSPEVDRATRLGRIRVTLGDHPALRIGAFARGTVTTATSRGLAVPSGAIQRGGDGATVLVVRDGLVATQKLDLGLAMDDRIEVRAGLKSGDLVVSRAGTFLRDGDAVRPILEPGKSAAVTGDITRTAAAGGQR
jgi:multidrug efflux pump subunit AcrA (membrane-fusion protein)